VTLRGILKVARRRGEYHLEPSSVLPIGWSPEYEPRTTTVDESNIDALLDALPRNHSAPTALAIATGARKGEVMAYQRGDIDMAAGFVLIRGTKTKSSRRRVPILEMTRPLLERVLRDAGDSEQPFAKWDWPYSALKWACHRLKIDRVTPNDLRRTFATRLQVRGVPNELNAKAMGHTSTSMIERVYGRADDSALAKLIRGHVDKVDTATGLQPTGLQTVELGDAVDSDEAIILREIRGPGETRTLSQRIKRPVETGQIASVKRIKNRALQPGCNPRTDLLVGGLLRSAVDSALAQDEAATLALMGRVYHLTQGGAA
jgi:hypothetical protein